MGVLMNVKRFILAVLAVFVLDQVGAYLIHGVLLMDDYLALQDVWRPDMMNYMWVMMLTSVVFSLLFVYVFVKGYEGKGIVEGVRYGIIIGLFMNFVGVVNQWVIYPITIGLAVKWFISFMILFVIHGIVVSAIYKPVE
jgi:hypothetical protein